MTETNEQQENGQVETPVAESVTPPVTDNSATTTEEVPEKVVPQSKVNEIVGAVKRDAYEKATRDFEAQLASPNADQGQTQVSQPPPVENAQPSNNDEFMAKFDQEVNRRVAMSEAQNQLEKFNHVVEGGRGKHEDFDAVVGQLNIVDNPYLIDLANKVENGGEVLYELAVNPAKFAGVAVLARNNSYTLAEKEFNKLSKSIKANESAMQQPKAQEPLSQISPSNTGTDNGLNTVSDYRSQPWLRG